METKDHFISRGWLEMFADEQGHIFTYNVPRGIINGPFICENTGFERGFWSVDFDALLRLGALQGVEDYRKYIDEMIFATFNKRIPYEELTPDQKMRAERYYDDYRGRACEDKQIKPLRDFFSWVRGQREGPAIAKDVKPFLSRFIVDEYCWGYPLRQQIMKAFHPPEKSAIDIDESTRKAIKHASAILIQIKQFVCNEEYRQRAISALSSHPWFILRNKTPFAFVVADRPLMLESFMKGGFFAQCIPLCADLVLVIYGQTNSDDPNQFFVHDFDDQDVARSVNHQIVRQSSEYVFSSDKGYLENLRETLKDAQNDPSTAMGILFDIGRPWNPFWQ